MAEMASGSGGPTFCGQCGAQSEGTKFCTQCGALLGGPGSAPADAVPRPSGPTPQATGIPGQQGVVSGVPVGYDPHTTMPQGVQAFPSASTLTGVTPPPLPPPPLQPMQPGATGGNRPLLIGGGVLAALVVIGALVGFLTLSGNKTDSTASSSSYSAFVVRYFQPVVSDNAKLAYGVATLSPSGSPSATATAVATTSADVKSAQQSLALVKVPAGDQTIAEQANAALSSESVWLKTVSTVLADPSSPVASQLATLGNDVSVKFETLGSSVRGLANTTLPDPTKIVAYASGVTANASAVQATTQFDNQVAALLDQSTSSFQQVNDFYNQLNSVVNGGSADFAIAQAEQEITSIIANRNSLEAAAQALNAPTPGAQAVAADLVAAFSASLKDDNDLSSCLNEANYGTVAIIYSSCLSSTQSDSSAATTEKQTFVAAYNQLRASVGQAAINPSF